MTFRNPSVYCDYRGSGHSSLETGLFFFLLFQHGHLFSYMCADEKNEDEKFK